MMLALQFSPTLASTKDVGRRWNDNNSPFTGLKADNFAKVVDWQKYEHTTKYE
jgi:hypothetical protein